LAPSIFEGLSIKVEQAKGEKCPRCWQWQKSSHVDNLCDRCEKII
jgi:hypothetical protein